MSLPSSLALTTIANASSLTSSPVRNNFSDIQVAVNGLITELGYAFSTYTPTWTAPSVNPAIGNGTITGRYVQVGKLVSGRITITAGGTTSFGTGAWDLTLPVTAAASVTQQVGQSVASDSSANQAYPGMVLAKNTTQVNVYTVAAPFGAAYSSAAPFGWATSDTLVITFQYEAA